MSYDPNLYAKNADGEYYVPEPVQNLKGRMTAILINDVYHNWLWWSKQRVIHELSNGYNGYIAGRVDAAYGFYHMVIAFAGVQEYFEDGCAD